MNGETLFDKFPEAVFRSLWEQMLLGTLPSELVSEVLAPLLSDYERVRLVLPSEVRCDFESILRVYPEIAAAHGIEPLPALPEVLGSLWTRIRRRKSGGPEVSPGVAADLAAQSQTPLPVAEDPLSAEGLIRPEGGRPVLIRIAYEPERQRLCFEAPSSSGRISLHLGGRFVLTLRPGVPGCLSVDRFLEAARDPETGGVELELFEEEAERM